MSISPDARAENSATEGSPNAASSLGSFAPPDDYAFEPELRGPVPRPIPPEVSHGNYARRRQATRWWLFGIAGMCLLLAQVPAVGEAGLYILPLAYLSWIGYGLLALWGVAVVHGFASPGLYRYIHEGQPLVARVVGLRLAPTMFHEGSPSAHAFFAALEYKDPFTSQIRVIETKSRDFSSSARDKWTTSFRIGDYVTAIYLGGDVERTLRLYGFLELNPAIGLVPADDGPRDKHSLWKIPLLIAAITGFFAVLVWNVIAIGRYMPIDPNPGWALVPIILGSLVLGGGILAWLRQIERRGRQRIAERNARARETGEAYEVPSPGPLEGRGAGGWAMTIILAAGSLLIGGATIWCWLITLNAWLDKSPAKEQPVRIKGLTMTTHAFLFREYTVEYSFPGKNGTDKLLSTPDHLRTLLHFDDGIAESHAGRFGWEWVRTIRPPPVAAK